MKENSIKINREDVKNLWKQGYRSPTEISRKTNVPLRSCERYVAQLRKNGKISDIHRSGRPRKVSPQMRRQIGRIVNSNHFVTAAAEIKARLEETHPDFEVSEQTIRDELFRLAYTVTLPRRVPLLTEQAKQNQLEWTQNNSHYNWRKVVFSDETTLQMFRNTCLAWSKHPFKLHVWGAICARGKVGTVHICGEYGSTSI